MNLEYYRNFIAIINAGSFIQAAKELCVAQSALSRQIHLLEKDYGTKLFQSGKGAHQLSLTDAGWIFYRQAKRLCELEAETRYEIENCSAGLQGTLRISLAPSRSPFFVSRYAKPFTQKYPGVSYEIRESYHLQLLEDVRQGRSEIGIAHAPIPDRSIFDVLFEREESLIVAGTSSDSFLSSNESIMSSELANHPLVFSRSLDEVMTRAAKKAGITLRRLAAIDNRSTALRFAQEGMAWAIVPWEDIEELPAGLIARPLIGLDERITKTIFCLRGQTLSPAMQRFLEVYEAELLNLLAMR